MAHYIIAGLAVDQLLQIARATKERTEPRMNLSCALDVVVYYVAGIIGFEDVSAGLYVRTYVRTYVRA